MKKTLLALTATLSLLQAQTLTLDTKQSSNWNIKSQLPTAVDYIPLGSFTGTVKTPPELLQTVSVPFEAQVNRLAIAPYSFVEKNALLAEITGTAWIEAQQKATADAVAMMHFQRIAERKAKLCTEEIIAQKECTAAEAELKTSQIKLEASKALLLAYGTTQERADKLLLDHRIERNLLLQAPFAGYITEVNIKPGSTVSPSEAMFVIMKKGELWLECDLNIDAASQLHRGDKVTIAANKKQFDTNVLELAPLIFIEFEILETTFIRLFSCFCNHYRKFR